MLALVLDELAFTIALAVPTVQKDVFYCCFTAALLLA